MSTPWERMKRTLGLNAANHRRMLAARDLVRAADRVRKMAPEAITPEDVEALKHTLKAGELLQAAFQRTNKIIEYRLQGGLTTDD